MDTKAKKQLSETDIISKFIIPAVRKPGWDSMLQIRHANTLNKPLSSLEFEDMVDVVVSNLPFGGTEEDGIEKNFPSEYQTRETADLFLQYIIEVLNEKGRAAVVLPDGTLFGEGVKTKIKKLLLDECNLHTLVRLPNSVFAPCAEWWGEGKTIAEKTKRKGRQENEFAWKVSIEDIIARNYNLDIKNPHVGEVISHDPEELLADYAKQQADIQALRDQLKTILSDALSH